MPKTSRLINLIPQKEFESSVTGRVLKWAMTTFRYIVIITEMIVMGVFLSRFWLDAQISDINDQIKNTSAIIQSQDEFENTFRDLQTKLNVFSEISKRAPVFQTIDSVKNKQPQGILLLSLSVQSNGVLIRGASASEQLIAQFVSNLKSEKAFADKVTLEQIGSNNNELGLILFDIKISK